MSAPCLEVSEVLVRFGGLTALDTVSMNVQAGEMVGLIGPNGAGKTTLLNVITGLIRPTSGRVRLTGRDCTRHPVYRRARSGVSRTFQRVGLFPELTIGQHVQLASDAKSGRHRSTDGAANEDPELILRRVGLDLPADTAIKGLPLGHARLVELAMGIAAGPDVLLLDEPLSGLSTASRRHMGDLLQQLRDQRGVGIVLVEHDIESVTKLVDRIVVLDFGKKIADGAPQDVLSDAAVRSAYFGKRKSQGAQR